MSDSVLINPPISSPLHPQLNLPLLKGYLQERGYKTQVCDTNIDFYHYFLGGNQKIDIKEILKDPIKILDFYSILDKKLSERSRDFEGLHVGLRSLAMKYDRISFAPVIQSLEDESANPFIAFYLDLIFAQFSQNPPQIFGIAITFQDQIIPAFTFANLIRKKMPKSKIVMGGQMITRCHESMAKSQPLSHYYDYLVLWDGEKGLYDIHREVISGKNVEFVNVIKNGDNRKNRVRRLEGAPTVKQIPHADFSDIDFNRYFYPEILVPFQTTRGCYASCAFCAIPFGSNGYKVRRFDTVVDDMLRIQEEIFAKYGKIATYFKFMEDTSAPSALSKISTEIAKRGLNLKWETFARLESAFAVPGMMEDLFAGGCRKIHWGLESNDPDILKNMNKGITMSYTDEILRLSGEAGILNFCFVLVGFPKETDEARENMVQYIIGNEHIHTLTISTFDLTRGAPMEQNFMPNNEYELDTRPAEDFQVRLPYTVGGKNWKSKIVASAHKMMIEIIKERPDIGFMTLFPDQVRSLFCEEFGNNWGKKFVLRYGESGVKEMLLNAQKYADEFDNFKQISPEKLPEPIRREHLRTKEDLALIARAMRMRMSYEVNRFEQV